MNALVTVIAAIVGALLYILASPPAPTRRPVLSELGRLTFLAAMIAIMLTFASRTTHLF